MKTEKYKAPIFKYEPMKVSMRKKVEEEESKIMRDTVLTVIFSLAIVVTLIIIMAWLGEKFNF